MKFCIIILISFTLLCRIRVSILAFLSGFDLYVIRNIRTQIIQTLNSRLHNTRTHSGVMSKNICIIALPSTWLEKIIAPGSFHSSITQAKVFSTDFILNFPCLRSESSCFRLCKQRRKLLSEPMSCKSLK